MSTIQLRRYEVRVGELERLLEAWRALLPVRQRHGFEVAFAYASAERSELVWAVRHGGDFEQAERAYYADPEGDELRARVTPHLQAVHVGLVRDVLA